MNKNWRKWLLAGALTFGLGAVASADELHLRAAPAIKPQLVAPRPSVQLGFVGYFSPGCGMIVQRVQPGTPAWRMGLEPGDEIRRVDGVCIDSPQEFQMLLDRTGAHAALQIADVRTGRLVTRVAHFHHVGYSNPQPWGHSHGHWQTWESPQAPPQTWSRVEDWKRFSQTPEVVKKAPAIQRGATF